MIGSTTTLFILLLASIYLNCILLYLMLDIKETSNGSKPQPCIGDIIDGGESNGPGTSHEKGVENNNSSKGCEPDEVAPLGEDGLHANETGSERTREHHAELTGDNDPVTLVQSQDQPGNDIAQDDDEQRDPSEQTSKPVLSEPEPTNKKDKPCELSRIRCYTSLQAGPFMVQGMSIQGRGHLIDNKPCQDYHFVDRLGNDFVIAVVSDGAGSKANSEYGSSVVCKKTVWYLKEAIRFLKWDKDNLPDSKTWKMVFRRIVQLVQGELGRYSKTEDRSFDSLAATLIVLLVGPGKTYAAHVGDGRAGVLTNDGWKAVMTPHTGVESNQTVFMTNQILDPDLEISGVAVPETGVIEEPVKAFVLMSDGLENGLWIKNKKEILPDGDFMYKKMNIPFEPALNDVIERMSKCEEGKEREHLFSILDHYNAPLKGEADDKTLCLAYTCSATNNTD